MDYLDFEDYLESEYENIGNTEFYECMGGHTWHISNIEQEYKQLMEAPEVKL